MLASLLRPLTRHPVAVADDPWTRTPFAVALHEYGQGAHRDFDWYFTGTSRVPTPSWEAMQAWLLTCQYRRDAEVFSEADYWQHPCAFEVLKEGDCEDFALWTWRKLAELGKDVEFVVGWQAAPGEDPTPHAWVLWHESSTSYLVDPVAGRPCLMRRSLPAVRNAYLPEASVDAQLQRYLYAGRLLRTAWVSVSDRTLQTTSAHVVRA